MDVNHRCQESTTTDEPPDPDELRRRIRRQETAIKRREVATAVRWLEAEDTLSETQRAILAEMADRIADRLLAAPTAALAEIDHNTGQDELVALARLFAPPDE